MPNTDTQPTVDEPVDATEPTDAVLDDDVLDDAVLDVAKIRRYQELRDAEKVADAERAALKAEADALERELVTMFADAGAQNLNVDGRTVYLHRSTFAQRAEGVTSDDIKAGLRAAGVGELVTETVNAQTLNAYVRELLDDDDPAGLPEPLRDLLELGERYAVRIKASTAPRRRK